jgi:hypothetical protein
MKIAAKQLAENAFLLMERWLFLGNKLPEADTQL